jgi:hypothetical protein
MLKDIQRTAVENIAVAIVPKEEAPEEGAEQMWEVYLLNLKEEPIDNVIVASRGYGSYKGDSVKTSVLRHYLGTLEGMTATLIEPIQQQVFGLNNEYWVSFYMKKEIFDKKYVFLPESISDDYFTFIPILEKRGVMIK